jgi:phytoene synthase
MNLTDALACQVVLLRGSKSFAAASFLLPPRVRFPAGAVYAFCRVTDDAVDAAGSGAGVLTRLAQRLDRVYAGHPEENPVDRAFAAVVARYRIPRAIPDALLEGYAWDLAGRSYEDLDAVIDYAARVAGTVGVMMTLLMGPRDPVTLARAADLGVAMQLTNIARDVGEDARAGRQYLPAAWLREAGIVPEALLAAPAFSPPLGGVVRRLLAEADALYRRSEDGLPRLPRDCRVAIAAARYLYAEIGAVILAAGADSVSSRAFTTGARKLRLMGRALPWLVRSPAAAAAPPLPGVRFLIDAVSATG